ncbi:MAG TPA: hypothetical protein VFE05_20165 [Longimicrobiaceae bacterium]|jgi:hypothetical protein|nr:hypothetical protein [Longimicrobiaceae bacterium]
MAFTLRITFSGLCLFVPERAAPGDTQGRMHVLMPGMFGHHHGPADRHIPVLAYDSGYLVEGGSLNDVTAVASLTGHTLTFGDGADAELRLCSQIVNLREVTDRPVHPDHLADDTQKKLVSRVTLGAGAMTRVSPGVCWEWGPGEFRPIAHRAEWEIPDFPGDRLVLAAVPFGGGGASRALGTLFPVDGLLSLDVLHETQADLPPEPLPLEHQHPPMPGESPMHFSAYFGVFGGPVPMRLPRYWGSLEECPDLSGGCPSIPPSMGGTPFKCLLAGNDP